MCAQSVARLGKSASFNMKSKVSGLSLIHLSCKVQKKFLGAEIPQEYNNLNLSHRKVC